jgi:hypothetical protein
MFFGEVVEAVHLEVEVAAGGTIAPDRQEVLKHRGTDGNLEDSPQEHEHSYTP